MKAAICKAIGDPGVLEIEEIQSLTPEPDQVVVSVKYAGLNFSDLLMLKGKYQHRPTLPFSPGAEASGYVKSVGSNVTEFKPGDRVICHGLFGAFAEEFVVEKTFVHHFEDLDLKVGAGIFATFGTALYGIQNLGQMKPGGTLLVLGASGGIGLAAIQIGKAVGARVIAGVSSQEKAEICLNYGADHILNYSVEANIINSIHELIGAKKTDVIFDSVGGTIAEIVFRELAWNGTHLIIGFASGSFPKIASNHIFIKGVRVVGVNWPDFCARQPTEKAILVEELIGLFRTEKLRAHIHKVFKLGEINAAVAEIQNRAVKGKILIEF